MNEILPTQENNNFQVQSKLFGMPRPVAGAFIGVLSFLLYVVLSRNTSIATILLSPGYLVVAVIISATNLLGLPKVIYEIAIYSVSSIPLALIGSLIDSTKKA